MNGQIPNPNQREKRLRIYQREKITRQYRLQIE